MFDVFLAIVCRKFSLTTARIMTLDFGKFVYIYENSDWAFRIEDYFIKQV